DELLSGAGFPLDEHREVCHRHLFNTVAHEPNTVALPHELTRTVGPAARARERPAAIGPLDLEQQTRHLRGGAGHLPCPAIHAARGIENRLEPRTTIDS